MDENSMQEFIHYDLSSQHAKLSDKLLVEALLEAKRKREELQKVHDRAVKIDLWNSSIGLHEWQEVVRHDGVTGFYCKKCELFVAFHSTRTVDGCVESC